MGIICSLFFIMVNLENLGKVRKKQKFPQPKDNYNPKVAFFFWYFLPTYTYICYYITKIIKHLQFLFEQF